MSASTSELESSTDITEFDLKSLTEKGLQQKLFDIECEYKEKAPMITEAIDASKRLMDLTIAKSVPDTKDILEQISEARATLLSTHAMKIKEIDAILEDINIQMISMNTKILQIQAMLKLLKRIEIRELVISEAELLALQSAIKDLEGADEESSTGNFQDLTIGDIIECVRRLEDDTKKSLACLEERKQETLARKDSWDTFTAEQIQKLDKTKEEHLKSSYKIITETIKTGEENLALGQQRLKTLERKYHAALQYRQLRYLESDNSPHSSPPTPR